MFRKYIFPLILFFGFCFNNLKGQTDNSLLWQLSGNGLVKPSYIYGTIHSICQDDLYVSDKLESSFSKCEKLVLEIDIDDPEMGQKLHKLSYNQNKENLKSRFKDPKDLEIVNDFFIETYGVGLDNLGTLKPFALLSMILQKSLDCNSPQSFERTFEDMAGKLEIEILGLETIEEQVALFDDVAIEDQLEWLVYYTKNRDELKNGMNDMISLYKKEDLEGLSELISKYPEYQQIEGKLLIERNRKWIAKIEQFAAETPTFFAVGAGHLPGDEGVLNLLKKAGYKVEAVY